MRAALALSFVVTVAVPGCATSDPGPSNSPPPQTEPPGPTCERDVFDQACENEDERCYLAENSGGCGLNGYSCRDGKWAEMMTYCNPPEAFE